MRPLVERALTVQEAHDLNLEYFGECPRCGEYGVAALGDPCEEG